MFPKCLFPFTLHQLAPQLVADYLQLHRLHMLAYDRALLPDNADLAQIIYQLFGHAGTKRTPTHFGWHAHRI